MTRDDTADFSAGFGWPDTELDPTTFPAFAERIVAQSPGAARHGRVWPGDRIALPPVRSRRLLAFDQVVSRRRSAREFQARGFDLGQLARLLGGAHGLGSEAAGAPRGPTPSTGGLNALELVVVNLTNPTPGPGAWFYERPAHALVHLPIDERTARWAELVPSLALLQSPAALVVILGDGARVAPVYGARGMRLMLLETGHLMQSLCLQATSMGAALCPLGGFFERPIAEALRLPNTDEVLYVGALGWPR